MFFCPVDGLARLCSFAEAPSSVWQLAAAVCAGMGFFFTLEVAGL